MIIVCPLSDLADAIREEKPYGVVTLLGPELMIPPIKALDEGRHLRLEMNDIASPQPGQILPGREHVETFLDYVDGWDHAQPLIIHCWAGISRSTAAALIAQAYLHPEASPDEMATDLGDIAPHAYPNRRLIELADEVLGRNGQLVAAAELVHRDKPVMEGVRFHYPLHRHK